MNQDPTQPSTYVIQDPTSGRDKALVGVTGLILTAVSLVLMLNEEWVFASIFAMLGVALLGSLFLMIRKTEIRVGHRGLSCTRWIVRKGPTQHFERAAIHSLEATLDVTFNQKTFYQVELITQDLQRHTLTDKMADRRDADALVRHLRDDLDLD